MVGTEMDEDRLEGVRMDVRWSRDGYEAGEGKCWPKEGSDAGEKANCFRRSAAFHRGRLGRRYPHLLPQLEMPASDPCRLFFWRGRKSVSLRKSMSESSAIEEYG